MASLQQPLCRSFCRRDFVYTEMLKKASVPFMWFLNHTCFELAYTLIFRSTNIPSLLEKKITKFEFQLIEIDIEFLPFPMT